MESAILYNKIYGWSLNLSFEQGREEYHDRGDLPIISILASDKSLSGQIPTGFSEEELIDALTSFHKDLTDLSNNGRYVVVNGTDHMSIVNDDVTSDHILSLIPLIEEMRK